MAKALRVARDLNEPRLAAMLLAPLRVEMFTRAHAPPLGRLAATYGDEWSGEMVGVWFGRDRPHSSAWSPDRATWAESLPSLCEPLCAAGEGGASMSRLLVSAAWTKLCESVAVDLGTRRPSQRERELAQAGLAIAAVLTSAAAIDALDLRDRVLAFLRQDNEHLPVVLMPALRAGAKLATTTRRESGLDAVAAYCAAQLSARLARPERAADDWSIELPDGCSCQLCTTLSDFPNDSDRRSFEWPLAEPKRQHVHGRIDASELPVRHETRRKGSPYTLVLTKTTVLFERESDQHRRDKTDLAWLKRTYRIQH